MHLLRCGTVRPFQFHHNPFWGLPANPRQPMNPAPTGSTLAQSPLFLTSASTLLHLPTVQNPLTPGLHAFCAHREVIAPLHENPCLLYPAPSTHPKTPRPSHLTDPLPIDKRDLNAQSADQHNVVLHWQHRTRKGLQVFPGPDQPAGRSPTAARHSAASTGAGIRPVRPAAVLHYRFERPEICGGTRLPVGAPSLWRL